MTDRNIQKSIYLAAAPSRVWDYLTDKALLAEWFHPAANDLADGQPYALLAKDGNELCSGEVIEMVQHKKLTYSFTAKPMNGLMTQVTWTLEAVEGGTRLSMIHKGFPAAAEAFGLLAAFDKGWDDHLQRMRAIDA